MKILKYFLFLSIPICLQACGDGMIKNKQTAAVDSTVQQVAHIDRKVNHVLQVENPEDLIGDWVGMFEPDSAHISNDDEDGNLSEKINISIDQITGTAVKGHSVVAGNYRPFTGEVVNMEKKFVFNVKEPGDDQYDGKFAFTIQKGDSLLKGDWKSYKSLKIPVRKYVLNKRFFNYNPKNKLDDFPFVNWKKMTKKVMEYGDGEKDTTEAYFASTDDIYKLNASTQELSRERVSNLKKADILILRNAIFARHGFSFKNKDLRTFFDMQSWYIPVSINIENELTALEKKNISLLMKYEQHAEEYYDVFGR